MGQKNLVILGGLAGVAGTGEKWRRSQPLGQSVVARSDRCTAHAGRRTVRDFTIAADNLISSTATAQQPGTGLKFSRAQRFRFRRVISSASTEPGRLPRGVAKIPV